jgi:hypothetical protein
MAPFAGDGFADSRNGFEAGASRISRVARVHLDAHLREHVPHGIAQVINDHVGDLLLPKEARDACMVSAMRTRVMGCIP